MQRVFPTLVFLHGVYAGMLVIKVVRPHLHGPSPKLVPDEKNYGSDALV